MSVKKDYSIDHQMHKDLIVAYNKVAPHCWTQQEAYEKMVKQPAPRYYVSAKQAYQVLAPMVRGDFSRVEMMLPLRRKMYESLFEEFVKVAEKPMFYNKSLWFIVQHVVTRPAPEFFISAERAKHIRCWLKNGVIDDEGRIVQTRLPSYERTREYQRKRREAKKQWMSEKM